MELVQAQINEADFVEIVLKRSFNRLNLLNVVGINEDGDTTIAFEVDLTPEEAYPRLEELREKYSK